MTTPGPLSVTGTVALVVTRQDDVVAPVVPVPEGVPGVVATLAVCRTGRTGARGLEDGGPPVTPPAPVGLGQPLATPTGVPPRPPGPVEAEAHSPCSTHSYLKVCRPLRNC